MTFTTPDRVYASLIRYPIPAVVATMVAGLDKLIMEMFSG